MRDGYPEFSKMVGRHEPIREIARQYLELERRINPEFLLRKMKSVYDMLEKDDRFEIPENPLGLEDFMVYMEPIFRRSIAEKREINNKSMKNVSYFVEMINDFDYSEQSGALKILEEFEKVMSKACEDKTRIEYHNDIQLIRDAYYRDFIDTLVDKIPSEKSFYTANKNGVDHIAFENDIKIGKMLRRVDESICSPKVNFESDYANGNINMGGVSCKRCIKSVIKISIPKPAPKRKAKL